MKYTITANACDDHDTDHEMSADEYARMKESKRMTREEALKLLYWYIVNKAGRLEKPKYLDALDALRGPQPDPETGLVPCGCGGKATIKKGNAAYSGYFAMCSGCECAVGFDRGNDDHRVFGEFPDEEQTKTAWNTAMGWRG